MTYDEFYRAADSYWKQHPEQRLGQAMFNYLAINYLDLADKLWSTDTDPFMDDNRVPAFLAEVRRMLEPSPSDEESEEEAARLDKALVDHVGGSATLRSHQQEIERGDRGVPLNDVFADLDQDERLGVVQSEGDDPAT